ncbi:MAG TPA: response regulator transcription factor [Pseudonocardia sp.]|nr:response regulator transcription factor [Pseudonocardia sp.]
MRVLVAGGDRQVVSSLKHALGDDGYVVDVALNGEHALWHAIEFEYDAVILEARLPGLDGIQVGLRLREHKPAIPILVLLPEDDCGAPGREARAIADAYMVEPVDLAVLTAQLSELTRVDADPRFRELRVGDLRMRPATRQAWRGDSELALSPREFALLRLFLTHPGKALTRQAILEHVWARHHNKAPNLVDQYVLYLRRKIDRPFAVHQLETVRGVGYRLREQPTATALTGYPERSKRSKNPDLMAVEHRVSH